MKSRSTNWGSDMDKLESFYQERKTNTDRWSDAQTVKKRRKYQKGMVAVNERMDTHAKYMQPTSTETIVQEYSGWKMTAQQHCAAPGALSTFWTITICDFSRCGTAEQISNTVKSMSDIVHQDGNNCGIVLMPMMYNKMPVERQLALTSKIEDLMIARIV